MGSGFHVVVWVIVLLLASGGNSRVLASSIFDPTNNQAILDNAASASWYVPCDYEYGGSASSDNACGGQFTTLSSSVGTGFGWLTGGGGVLNVSGGYGSDWAFQEIDTYSPFSGMFDNYYDAVVFNVEYLPGPTNFTFASDAGDPITVPGMETTLYQLQPFQATVTAFDASGTQLGSLTFASVENDQLFAFSCCRPTYYANVGIADVNFGDNNIASIVISTDGYTPDGYGIGTTYIDAVPEPSSFSLMLCAGAALWCVRRKHYSKSISKDLSR